MKNNYNVDELFRELETDLKRKPSKDLIFRIEDFAVNKTRQLEKFTIGQILSIAASFILIALVNFSVMNPNIENVASTQEEFASYQFIPVNSLYNE